MSSKIHACPPSLSDSSPMSKEFVNATPRKNAMMISLMMRNLPAHKTPCNHIRSQLSA